MYVSFKILCSKLRHIVRDFKKSLALGTTAGAHQPILISFRGPAKALHQQAPKARVSRNQQEGYLNRRCKIVCSRGDLKNGKINLRKSAINQRGGGFTSNSKLCKYNKLFITIIALFHQVPYNFPNCIHIFIFFLTDTYKKKIEQIDLYTALDIVLLQKR